MYIGNKGAFLAGVSTISLAPERKEAGTLTAEVKEAVEALGRTFETFKTKNDERLAQVEKKREDVVTAAEVDKINAAIDEAKATLQKRLDEMEMKANRLALTGGDSATEANAAATFADLVGRKGYTPAEMAEYKGDLGHYLRRNEQKMTTLAVGTDPAGGFWVTPDVTGRIVSKIYETSPMRQLCNIVTIGTDRLEGPIDNGQFSAAWVGEQGTRSQTDVAQLGMWGIDVNELYAYPLVTQKLLEDSRIDVEGWIGKKCTNLFARKENAAFVTGTGIQQPKGIMSYVTSASDDLSRAWGQFQYLPTTNANGFASTNAADCLLDLIFNLKAGYRQNAKFLTARKTLAQIRKIKDGQGNYLAGLRLNDGALVENIFGFDVVDGEDMPQIAANAFPVAFGDFEETYTIVDRLGISVIRDNITSPGFVKYNMRKRVGGGVVNFESMKLLKCATS